MIRRLKTWEQFEKEFKSFADEWTKNYDYYDNYHIKYNGMIWNIASPMIDLFGTEIKVFEIKKYRGKNYTHHGDIGVGWNWHELWFEPEFKEIEFIKKEEVML